MQFASIVVAAGIGMVCCNAAGRQADEGWVEAQSLRELPPGVQVLLGVGLAPGEGGIVDRDVRFNTGEAGMPRRRFALGIVHGDTALVAIERGGRGYAVQTMEFKQVGTTWETARCSVTRKLPRHGDDMLEAIAHPAPGLPSCSLGAVTPIVVQTASGQ